VHVHPGAAERFTVVEGAPAVRVGRRRVTVADGESVVAPAGTPHGYRGIPGTAARVIIEPEPPGGMAEFFASFYGVPADGRSRSAAQATTCRMLGRHRSSRATPCRNRPVPGCANGEHLIRRRRRRAQ
jgi:Cupin domain